MSGLFAIGAPSAASSQSSAIPGGVLDAEVPAAAADTTVVILVRHAERAEDGTDDPPLSEAGHARARLLARTLRDAGITRIHTTDYRRTRSTGRPLSDELELTMEVYDGSELSEMARRLRNAPGRHLVVGHSNTTPELVEALGADPGPPIDHMEYDRLYVVILHEGVTTSILLRFGAPFRR